MTNECKMLVQTYKAKCKQKSKWNKPHFKQNKHTFGYRLFCFLTLCFLRFALLFCLSQFCGFLCYYPNFCCFSHQPSTETCLQLDVKANSQKINLWLWVKKSGSYSSISQSVENLCCIATYLTQKGSHPQRWCHPQPQSGCAPASPTDPWKRPCCPGPPCFGVGQPK